MRINTVLSVLVGAITASVAPATAQEMKFTDATASAGLPAPDWPSPGGGQVTWGDYDGDAHEDLLVGCSRLYRNSGPPNYTFTQTLTLAGGNGGIWADVVLAEAPRRAHEPHATVGPRAGDFVRAVIRRI